MTSPVICRVEIVIIVKCVVVAKLKYLHVNISMCFKKMCFKKSNISLQQHRKIAFKDILIDLYVYELLKIRQKVS